MLLDVIGQIQQINPAQNPQSIITNSVLLGIIGFIISGLLTGSLFLIKHIWNERKKEMIQDRIDSKEFNGLLLERMDGFDKYAHDQEKNTIVLQNSFNQLQAQTKLLFRKSDNHSEKINSAEKDIIKIKGKLDIE
jgi:hypothetical protein